MKVMPMPSVSVHRLTDRVESKKVVMKIQVEIDKNQPQDSGKDHIICTKTHTVTNPKGIPNEHPDELAHSQLSTGRMYALIARMICAVLRQFYTMQTKIECTQNKSSSFRLSVDSRNRSTPNM